MTTPTPEQFMAQTEPDETDDLDPLVAIATHLQAIAANFTGNTREAELQQTIDDLEVQVASVNEVLDQVLDACGKSKGQLAVRVREVILGPGEQPASPDDGATPPANDADVEEWRAYARGLGLVDGLDQANRSQIRTMLGISHSEGANATA